jgi:hypothetical protein
MYISEKFGESVYSARALFKPMQIFSISLVLKFDPDVIETFCLLPLKAEIHAIPVRKDCTLIGELMAELFLYTFRAVENYRLEKNGVTVLQYCTFTSTVYKWRSITNQCK